MLILNFSRPLTDEQIAQTTRLAGCAIEEVRTFRVQVDQRHALEPQIRAIVDNVGLTSKEWQTRQLLINLSNYVPAAIVLLAELHGRIGHFPAFICLRPRPSSTVATFEVAELLNLQAIREEARKRR